MGETESKVLRNRKQSAIMRNKQCLKSFMNVGNSEAAKEGDTCPLALDPWPH